MREGIGRASLVFADTLLLWWQNVCKCSLFLVRLKAEEDEDDAAQQDASILQQRPGGFRLQETITNGSSPNSSRTSGNRRQEDGAGVGSFYDPNPGIQMRSLKASNNFRVCGFLLQKLFARTNEPKQLTTLAEQITETFYSVLFVNVLEHIEDDASELSIVHEALNPNGHLLIFVPALPGSAGEPDRQVGHFRRYVKKDLVELTQRSGFFVVKARYFDIAGIIPWYINVLLHKKVIGGRGGSILYKRLVVPEMRIIERFMPPPIGKNVLMVPRSLTKPSSRRTDHYTFFQIRRQFHKLLNLSLQPNKRSRVPQLCTDARRSSRLIRALLHI